MIKLPEAVKATNKTVTDTLNNALPGLNEMTGYLTQSMGKGIRALLLLNAAMDSEGYVPERAVKVAAAVELLHMATLVHDDIMDDAPTRRGMETVQRKFGHKRAVICGDYLLCLSLSLAVSAEQTDDMMRDIPAMRFTRALSSICRGEYLQFQNNGNIDLDVFTYLKIIAGKTAALFYLSAYLGALLGNEEDKNARAIGRFGHYLGIIFQIVDDCKDYEFSEAAALKPVGKDLAEGVVTLPLIIAMSKEPILRDLACEAMKAKQSLPRLIKEVNRFGGPEDSRAVARRYEGKAVRSLNDVSGLKRDNLMALLQKALGAATHF